MKDKNRKKNPAARIGIAAAAAALWIASLAFALHVRAGSARLAEKTAANRALVAELGLCHEAVATHLDFIASVPKAQPSMAALVPGVVENTVQFGQYGLRRTSAGAKWASVGADEFSRIVESAGKLSPPFRPESVTISKASDSAANLSVEAQFTAYGR